MKGHLFSFETIWHVPHDLKTVWNSIGMVAHYPTWWPGMKEVEILRGHELPVAVGNTFRFTVASVLYDLSYTTEVTDYEVGKRIVAKAEGDLVGIGTWTFKESDNETEARFLWEVELTPPVLRVASRVPVVPPVMRFFHDRLMRAGEKGLQELLATSSQDSLVEA